MSKDIAQDKVVGAGWAELLRRAADGDQQASERIFAEVGPYLQRVFEYEFGSAKAQVDASGVVQDCLLKFWQKAGTFRGQTDAEARAWLRTIARNEFLTQIRRAGARARKVPLPLDKDGAVAIAAGTSSPSRRMRRDEDQQYREEAFKRLSADEQEILRLRYCQDLDWPAIADQMGRSEGAAKRVYYRAVQRWKAAVEMQP